MSFNILLAEDDEDIVKLLKLYLENEGFRRFGQRTAWRQRRFSTNKNRPCARRYHDAQNERLRTYKIHPSKSNVPIIILSAAQLDSDKILGLNLGADDYMVKPFNPLELIARINANLRRFYKLGNMQEEDDGKITIGELTLDTNTLTLEKSGVPVNLTATEYKILLMLMKSPGRVFTKMQIYEEVNGDYYANDDNTMMVHISNLRDKIEDDPKTRAT